MTAKHDGVLPAVRDVLSSKAVSQTEAFRLFYDFLKNHRQHEERDTLCQIGLSLAQNESEKNEMLEESAQTFKKEEDLQAFLEQQNPGYSANGNVKPKEADEADVNLTLPSLPKDDSAIIKDQTDSQIHKEDKKTIAAERKAAKKAKKEAKKEKKEKKKERKEAKKKERGENKKRKLEVISR